MPTPPPPPPLVNTTAMFSKYQFSKGELPLQGQLFIMAAPTLTLDQAISSVIKSEATLTADKSNVDSIQANISTASAPLPDAQAKVTADVTQYNSDLDSLIAVATASKIPVA